MKTKYYFSLLIVTSFLGLSCKEEVEAQESSTGDPKEIIMPRVQPLPVPSPNPVTVPNQAIQNTPQAMPQPVAVAKGMNPAHGQPGHRCDIAVGAPLNSPVKSNLATNATKSNPFTVKDPSIPSTITPATTTTSSTPALLNPDTTVTAAGMNPPHGQAGHVCSVKVGDPLPK